MFLFHFAKIFVRTKIQLWNDNKQYLLEKEKLQLSL